MMAYDPKDGTGTFSKNKYKKSDNQPDIKGTFKWRGEVVELAAWRKERDDGSVYYSMKVSEPRVKSEPQEKRQERPAARPPLDDDSIPF